LDAHEDLVPFYTNNEYVIVTLNNIYIYIYIYVCVCVCVCVCVKKGSYMTMLIDLISHSTLSLSPSLHMSLSLSAQIPIIFVQK
jgi:hypothetical protein